MSLTGPTVIASGGDTVQDIGGYRIHTFTTVGTSSFVVNRGGSVEVLVVAGGGGGGSQRSNQTGGGGGAGELFTTSTNVVQSIIDVTIGAGGLASTENPYVSSTNGGDSIFGTFQVKGGGRGGSSSGSRVTREGGSGGGTSRRDGVVTASASTATIGMGNIGGVQGGTVFAFASGSGGGGALSPGQNSYNVSVMTPGGIGYMTSISGASRVYAEGGAGGARNSNDIIGISANANTGSGGGGASGDPSSGVNGGSGGSGIVIVRYQLCMFLGPATGAMRGIFTSTPNGLTSAQPATNALALRVGYPGYDDGVYWINCGGVPTQTYCLMNPKWDGGGWMLIMKAAQGSTFNWGSTHWTTTSTLNPTDTTTTVADAKFDVFNSVPVTDVMAVWPTSDIGAGNTGGSLAVSDGWVWLVKNWYTSAITPLAGFQIDRPATPPDIFNFSGFSTSSPIWSYQTGLRAHVFGSGSHVPSAPGSDVYFTRWGFMWNNESGTTHTQDAFAGIGLNSPSSSGGDFWFWTGVNKKGFNRNIAWLMYGR